MTTVVMSERSGTPPAYLPETRTEESTIIIQPGQHAELMLASRRGQEVGRERIRSVLLSQETIQLRIAQAANDGRPLTQPVAPTLVVTAPFSFGIQRLSYQVKINPDNKHFALSICPDTIYNRTSVPVMLTTLRVVETSGTPGVSTFQTTTRKDTFIIHPGEHADVILAPTSAREAGPNAATGPWVSAYTRQVRIAQSSANGQPIASPLVFTNTSFSMLKSERSDYQVDISPQTHRFTIQ